MTYDFGIHCRSPFGSRHNAARAAWFTSVDVKSANQFGVRELFGYQPPAKITLEPR